MELSNGSYSGYCVGIEDYEPIVKEVQSLTCANNQLQVAGADVCDDFDPINFDCRNFHSGWDFVVQQTNLSHFSHTDQQTGTTQTLEFERASSQDSNGIDFSAIGGFDSDLINNPWGMAYVSCNNFQSSASDPVLVSI